MKCVKQLCIFSLMVLMLLFGNTASAEGVTIHSDDGDLVSLFNDVSVKQEQEHDIVVIAGDLDVQADVNGDVVIVFGNARINARIGGSVVNVLGDLTLDERAEVDEDLVAIGKLNKLPGSVIYGEQINMFIPSIDPLFLFSARVVWIFVQAILSLILGFLMVTFFREKTEGIFQNAGQDTVRIFLIGLLAIIGMTIVSVLLAITLILPLLYFFLLLWSGTIGCIYLGKVLLKNTMPGSRSFLELLAGVAAVTLIKVILVFSIPAEYFLTGYLVIAIFGFIIDSAGMGLVLNSRMRRRQNRAV